MSATMPESHRDLLDTPVAAFSTIGPMGYPQTTAVWFLNDNGRIVVVIHPDRQKTKNLQATPKCDFFIVDPANPLYAGPPPHRLSARSGPGKRYQHGRLTPRQGLPVVNV